MVLNLQLLTLKMVFHRGSVLGPLLFLLYINDMHQAIKNSSTLHFADDTSIIYVDKSFKKINKLVNNDLKNLLCVA